MADMGRPSLYCDEIVDRICERLACGESIIAMCRDDDMPSKTTVFKWLFHNSDFADKYARARAAQAEPHLEDLLKIADDENIPSDQKRIMVDARKWAMSKLAAKKYGDKALLGSDPENPLPSGPDLSRLSTAALKELASLATDK